MFVKSAVITDEKITKSMWEWVIRPLRTGNFGQVESFLVLDFAVTVTARLGGAVLVEIRLWRINEIHCLRGFSATTLFQETFYGSILICRSYFNLDPEKRPGDEVVVVYLNRSGNDRVSLSFKIKSKIKIAPRKGIHYSQRFWIPWVVFWIPKPRIPDSMHEQKFPLFRNPDSLSLRYQELIWVYRLLHPFFAHECINADEVRALCPYLVNKIPWISLRFKMQWLL